MAKYGRKLKKKEEEEFERDIQTAKKNTRGKDEAGNEIG